MRWTQHDVDEFLARQRTPGSRVGARQGVEPIASPAAPQKARRAKYGNVKVTDAEGNVHDSTKEYRRWLELEALQRAGNISQLRRQVAFPLIVPDKQGIPQLICTYVADAVYVEGAATVVEDCKSPPTRAKPEYRIKLKLMQTLHGIQIHEV